MKTNYIFDLYGTLVDIVADESSPALWKHLAEFYKVYGSIWTPEQLEDTFRAFDAEERHILAQRNGSVHPEIKLERVFIRLLFERPKLIPMDLYWTIRETEDPNNFLGRSYNPQHMRIKGVSISTWRKRYLKDKEATIQSLMTSDWAVAVSNLFRITSRKHLRLYKNTASTLNALHESGKKVYLLSNAQKIFTMPELEELGLPALFDEMYISSDAEMMKPEKRFMELLLTKEGLDPKDCVIVGNEFFSDIAIARRAGVDSYFLNTAHEPEEEVRRKYRRFCAFEKNPMKVKTKIILSGDIKEILTDEF
jgi:putative hydrolase of the HAD superfamily